MASAYLQNQINALLMKSNTSSLILPELSIYHTEICKKHLKFSLEPKNKKSFEDLIKTGNLVFNSGDIEENIRYVKLQEAKKLKAQLESKLQNVSSSIESLSLIDHYLEQKKPDMKNSNFRHSYFKEQNEKTKSFQNDLQKYHKFYKKSKYNRKAYLESLSKQQLEAESEKQAQILQQKAVKAQEYQLLLKEMQEKTKIRHEYMKIQRASDSNLKQVLNSKPLYVKLSEDYKKKIEMPELEKRKQELSKKRIISAKKLDTTGEHNNSIISPSLSKSQKDQASDLHSKSVIQSISTWSKYVIEEEKEIKAKIKREREEKERILKKRIDYGKIVISAHLPVVDKAKQEEIAKRKIKNSESTKIITDNKNESVWKPHKFKQNSMAPVVKEQRMAKSVDYLAQARQDMEKSVKNCELINDFDWDEKLSTLPMNEKIKKIKEQSKKLDSTLKQQERLANAFTDTAKSMKYLDNVDDILLKTIKTKLAVLEAI